MNYPKSIFGENLTRTSGTTDLMNDLGEALALGQGKIHLLGGGTPAKIPEVQAVWRARMAEMLDKTPGNFRCRALRLRSARWQPEVSRNDG